jgi:peroxiredoxin
MHLKAPCQGIDFSSKDIFGEPFQLSDYIGKRVVLSFFRDAACPFCNYRVYELTHKYNDWKSAGVEVVVVFSDTSEQVRKHVARHPRPFKMLSDPNLELYNIYGVERSFMAVVKAVFFKLPEILKGFAKGGRATKNPHMDIVPADFLIDVDGRVVELYYGKNTADHIPLERIQRFAAKKSKSKKSRRRMEAELLELKKENAKLKAK